MNSTAILERLRQHIPKLLAVYAFGSRVRGDANKDSDLDLAVLVEGYADPIVLWNLANDLIDITECPVDLLDLRAASTVMQHQIITGGERLWQKDSSPGLFEAAALSEKTELDTARAALLSDIKAQGTIYGR
jgi:predicted nucleotidyltransferase